jgi:hypothetical protein
MRPARRRRVLPREVTAMLTLGAAALVFIFAVAPAHLHPHGVAVLATAHLTDDDADRALFTETSLAPGQQVSRCVRVSYQGAASNGKVRLHAVGVSGQLAVRVEQGSGGGFDDCTGFTGGVLYDGDLTGLAAGTPDQPGVATGWQPAAGARTYRFTVTMPSTATPGQSATATFRWLLVGAGPVDTGSEPTSASPTPLVTDPAAASATPSSSASTQPEPSESATATPQPSASPVPSPAPGQGRRPDAVSTVGQFLARVAQAAVNVTRRTVRHSGFPLALLAAVGAFLLLQKYIDWQDPKLALAPMIEEYVSLEPFGAPAAGKDDA